MKIEIENNEFGLSINEYIRTCNDDELLRILNSIKEEISSRIVYITDGYKQYWKK